MAGIIKPEGIFLNNWKPKNWTLSELNSVPWAATDSCATPYKLMELNSQRWQFNWLPYFVPFQIPKMDFTNQMR